MMYLIYNHDGSIKLTNLNEVITQGSTTTEIFVAIDGFNIATHEAIATYILPNKSESAGNGVAIEDVEVLNGVYDGWVFSLTQDETYYYGKLLMSVKVYRTGTSEVLFTIPIELTINKSGFVASETSITITQYTNLISQLSTYITNGGTEEITGYKTFTADIIEFKDIETHDVLPASNHTYNIGSSTMYYHYAYIDYLVSGTTNIDVSTIATKSYVNTSIASAISNVYKFMGSYIVSELNALDVDSSFNGNVYNVQDSGTLQGWGGYTTVVNPGDNVAIVYPENGHWYWDKLASTIDLSAYALKTEATALYKHTMVLQDDNQQNWNVVIISPVSTALTSGSINSDVINFFARYDWYGFIAIASGSSVNFKTNILGYLTDTGEQVYLSFVNISNEIMQVEFWTVVSDSVSKI